MYFTVKDGTKIFYKDWGNGQPILFLHGWLMSADAWDAEMIFFLQRGYRVIAYDLRGHGRSDQPWRGNDMDTYTEDLAELLEKLDVKDAILVGHSTGGGEVVRYLARHGDKRVAKAVLITSVPPSMAYHPEKNPNGLPMSIFDAMRQGISTNRAQFYLDMSSAHFGFNLPGAVVSEGVRQQMVQQALQGSVHSQYECIKAFSETDFTRIWVRSMYQHLCCMGAKTGFCRLRYPVRGRLSWSTTANSWSSREDFMECV